MSTIYKITYPNGKIYVGKDVTGTLTYMGSVNQALVAADMTPEQRRDFVLRKQILWESETASGRDISQAEVRFIRELRSNDPQIGYNRWPAYRHSRKENTPPPPKTRNKQLPMADIEKLLRANPAMSNMELSKAAHTTQRNAANIRKLLNLPRATTVGAEAVREMFKAGKDRATIARELGLSGQRVLQDLKRAGLVDSAYRPVDWDSEPELGMVVDAVLADRHNVTVSTVALARKKRGIPSAAKAAYVNWDEQPLGEVPDIQLAERLGVHIASVAYARQRRGIASFRSTLRDQTVTALPEDPSA